MKLSPRYFCSIFLMLTIGCAGCSGDADDAENELANTRPFAGLTVEIAVPAGRNFQTDWQSFLSEWSFRNDSEYRLLEYETESNNELSRRLKDLAAGEKTHPDVMLVPWQAVPGLVADDALAKIPRDLQGQEQLHWLGYYTGLRNRVATVAGEPRLIPVSSPVLVLYYRQDLLESAGLNPPRTWDEYQTLLETREDWAPGKTAVEPWGESFRASMFLARAAPVAKHAEQFSFCFDLSSGEPLIDNPGFVSALDQARKAFGRMPGDVASYSPDDCRREILEGRAAIAIAYETRTDAAVMRADNVQIGIAPLPGTRRVYNTAVNDWVELEDDDVHRVTFTAFTGWAVGVANGLEEIPHAAAWELARYMAVDQLTTGFPKDMVAPTRDAQSQDPAPWTGLELTTSESAEYVAAVSDSLRRDQLTKELPLIGAERFREALTQELSSIFGTDADSEAILRAVADEWRKIIEDIGREKIVESYEQGLD